MAALALSLNLSPHPAALSCRKVTMGLSEECVSFFELLAYEPRW